MIEKDIFARIHGLGIINAAEITRTVTSGYGRMPCKHYETD
jgi:hypothetical protein